MRSICCWEKFLVETSLGMETTDFVYLLLSSLLRADSSLEWIEMQVSVLDRDILGDVESFHSFSFQNLFRKRSWWLSYQEEMRCRQFKMKLDFYETWHRLFKTKKDNRHCFFCWWKHGGSFLLAASSPCAALLYVLLEEKQNQVDMDLIFHFQNFNSWY